MTDPAAAAASPGEDPVPPVIAELPAAPAFIRLARLLVACFLESHLVVPDVRDHGVRLAVTEIFTAALEAQRQSQVDDPLVLRLRLCDGGADISLQDHGAPTSAPLPPVQLDGDLGVRAGLVLAMALVDDVWVEPLDGGSVVHLVVRAERRSAADE